MEVVEIIAILLAREAGAIFVDAFKLTVTHDFCVRVVGLQGAEQSYQSCTLGWRTGVG